MIGARLGSHAAFLGSAVGSASDDEGANSTGPTATKDATSGIYVPANATEWGSVLSAAGIASGGPQFLWLLQDAASPAAEALGTGVTLATSGTAGTFATAIAGWSRVGWQMGTDGATGRLLSTSALLPNPSSTSALILAYLAVLATPAATRQTFGTFNGTNVNAGVTSTDLAQVADGASVATGPSAVGTVVRPWVLKYDHTNSVTKLYTNQDAVSPTFTLGVGQAFTIGEVNSTSPEMWCGYATMFTGSAAELTDVQVRSLLQTLGWTVGW